MRVQPTKENVSLVEVLTSNKKELDRIALDFLPASHSNPEISALYRMMREYPLRGGKGLRGSICILWCELFNGRRENALLTAAALEMYQNWILIHDDIEDDSDLRRGLPTLHRKYGVPLSINAGDALHGKMWEFLIQNKRLVGNETSIAVMGEFSKMLNETTEGQQMELAWTSEDNWDIKESDYMLMVTKKAAWYTCICPCRLGVILSQSAYGAHLLDSIVEFGTDLGISFQIIDDILNLTADPAKYGKEILGDIFEGKRTLMLIHLLSRCTKEERSRVLGIVSKARRDKTEKDAEFVFTLMKHYGSIEYARGTAHRHSDSALKKFECILSSESIERGQAYLTTKTLIEYMTKRDY